MPKEKNVFASFFVTLPNALVVSLPLILVGHRLDYRAIFRGLWLNLSSTVLMVASSLTM